MAWAFVAQTGLPGDNTTSSVVGVQFGGNNAAGNTIIATASWGIATAGSTFTDSQGNTYTVRKEINDATNSQSASYASAINIAGGSASSVVAHFTAASAHLVAAMEYSGIASFDVAAGQVVAGSTAADNVNSTLATTSTTNDLCWGAMFDIAGSTNTLSAGTGFTARINAANSSAGPTALITEDRNIALSGASTRATFTQKQAHRYIALMGAFKETVAAGGALVVPPSFTMMGMQ